MTTNVATPVVDHGVNNLDNGLNMNEAANSDAFMDIANEMFGIEPEVVEEEEIVEAEEPEEELEEELVEEEVLEEEPVEEEEPEEELPAENVYVVTIDGEEFEVEEDELLSGYQRQRDYTRKTQEVAEQRKQIKVDLEMLAAERNKYVTALEGIIADESKSLERFNDVDWAKLRVENPNEFLMLQYEMNEARTSLQRKMDARTEAYNQAQAEEQIAENALLEREGERVAQLVEGWNGENSAQLRIDLRSQSKVEGFTEEDEGLLKHAMVIKLLQKAKAYDDLQTKAKNVGQKKLERKVPKVVKSGVRGNATEAERVKHTQAQYDKFKQSGNIQDSLELFKNFL